MRLLGRERELFDREEEPDGKRKGPRDSERSARQPYAATRIGFDVEGMLEREVWQGADPEDHENGQGHQGDPDRETEGNLDSPDVEPDEEGIGDKPPERSERVGRLEDIAEVTADPHHDHRRREDVLDVFGKTGDEPPHGPMAERAKE